MDPRERWSKAFETLVREERADPPTEEGDGAWTLHLACSLASAVSILSVLPGKYERVYEETEELIDNTGEGIDTEWESEVWVCDEQRAIFSHVDHWQAGLTATISVYATDDSYRSARERIGEDA